MKNSVMNKIFVLFCLFWISACNSNSINNKGNNDKEDDLYHQIKFDKWDYKYSTLNTQIHSKIFLIPGAILKKSIHITLRVNDQSIGQLNSITCDIKSPQDICDISLTTLNTGETYVVATLPDKHEVSSDKFTVLNNKFYIEDFATGSVTIKSQLNTSVSLTPGIDMEGKTIKISLFAQKEGDLLIEPSTCSLSNDNKSCPITITALKLGNTHIIAQADGEKSYISKDIEIVPMPKVNISSFVTEAINIHAESKVSVSISSDGKMIYPVSVNLKINDSAIAKLDKFQCVFPNKDNLTCDVIITPLKFGNIQLTAYGNNFESVTSEILHIVPKLVDIVAGKSLTCGLDDDGLAYCLGSNEKGGIGNDDKQTKNFAYLSPVKMPQDKKFIKLLTNNSGFSNTVCGLSKNLDNYDLYCWGEFYNSIEKNIYYVPTLVNPPEGTNFTIDIAVGDKFICAKTNNDKLYCWGDNSYGRLGIDKLDAVIMTPTEVVIPSGVTKLSKVVASQNNACAFGDDDHVYCWGMGTPGTLGNNEAEHSYKPVQVIQPEGVKFKSISLGAYHACALGDNNLSYCWGSNTNGKLGNGNTKVEKFLIPTLVLDSDNLAFNSLLSGGDHSCGFNKNKNAIYCWGWNKFGQLGIGTGSGEDTDNNNNSYKPIQTKVPAAISASVFVTGDFHNCLLDQEGIAYCWGININGETGGIDLKVHNLPSLISF